MIIDNTDPKNASTSYDSMVDNFMICVFTCYLILLLV